MPASASPPPSPPVRTPGQQPSHPASATNRSRTPQNDRFALYSPRNPDRRWIRAKRHGVGGRHAYDVQAGPLFPRDQFRGHRGRIRRLRTGERVRIGGRPEGSSPRLPSASVRSPPIQRPRRSTWSGCAGESRQRSRWTTSHGRRSSCPRCRCTARVSCSGAMGRHRVDGQSTPRWPGPTASSGSVKSQGALRKRS